MMHAKPSLFGWLAAVYLAVWVALAIDPVNRADWALEHVLGLPCLAALVATRRRYPLSSFAYATITLFLCLHALGAHYTYSLVPYESWFQAAIGWSPAAEFGWTRNHYDRLVHLSYGLLLAVPIRQWLIQTRSVNTVWSYLLPVEIVASTSMVFELIEWAAAAAFSTELGTAYVGTQGDGWDAQKDMALAVAGAALSMIAAAFARLGPSTSAASMTAESRRNPAI